MRDVTFKTSVFLSFPKPHMQRQDKFVAVLCGYLDERGLTARTLGVTDYDSDAPLTAIRRLMLESNGLIAIAFRRSHHDRMVVNANSDIGDRPERVVKGSWSTSIWAHVEPAMAYQLGLPILLLREHGVLAEGIFERGVVGLYSPEFDLATDPADFLKSSEWQQIVRQWEGRVMRVAENKGRPPQLY
jgi:hypothetical protein